jgi:hypothetical protein
MNNADVSLSLFSSEHTPWILVKFGVGFYRGN